MIRIYNRIAMRFFPKLSFISIMAFLMVLSCAIPVYSSSLSISPGHISIFYEPGTTVPVWFEATNRDNTPKYIRLIPVSKTGVQDSVKIDSPDMYFPAGSTQQIHFVVQMTQGMPYGEHDILVRLMPSDTPLSQASSHVSAIELVNFLVKLYVPYPGKYLRAILRVPMYNKLGESVPFEIEAINLGQERLEKVQGFIDISLNDKVIKTIETDIQSINSKEKAMLKANLLTDGLSIGKYQALARVVYDANSTETSQVFYLGELQVDILNISKNEFEKDEINKFMIDVENRWSEDINGIYATVFLKKDGTIYSTADTQTTMLAKTAKGSIPAYLDTNGVSAGSYQLEVVLKYASKETSRTFDVTVVKSPFKDWPLLLQSLNVVNVSIGVLILIILVNLIWFFVRRKKKDGDK